MHIPALLLALAALYPHLTNGQNITATSTTIQSAAFNLVILSNNATLNGSLLGACHDGAAHESVCLVNGAQNPTDYFVSWQHNTTISTCTDTNDTGTYPVPCPWDPNPDIAHLPGPITWWMPYTSGDGTILRANQAVYLEYLPWTNVAQAQVSFSTGSDVVFDLDEKLGVVAYQDDRLEPEYEYLPTPLTLYRWYICNTYFVSYRYVSLVWVMGDTKPQNPTCQAVEVKRVFL